MANKLIDVYYYFKRTNYNRLTYKELDDVIGRAINEKVPLMAARLGAVESANLRMVEFNYKKKKKINFDMLCVQAGFFPQDIDLLDRFYNIYISAIPKADIIFPLRFKGENYLLKKYSSPNVLYSPGDLFVSRGDYIWMRHLKGKKVLVIHPFEETIKRQYSTNRERIYENKDVLPEFELKTLKAVQTAAFEKDERFKDWFEALEWMHEESLKIDYDIALIGCGAYGFPLASMIKQDGKIAIHIGGSLQLMFGIKGMRWEQDPKTKEQLYNDYWVYASDNERPEHFELIEGSSYWQTVDTES